MTDSAMLTLTALVGVPEIKEGNDLPGIIMAALAETGLGLQAGDVIVLAQKIVSKAEGRTVVLDSIKPSAEACSLASASKKDPRIVELILAESDEILRVRPGLIIAVHRLGFICANAGIDQSNIGAESEPERALLLPCDPDKSSARIRRALTARTGIDVAVIIIDSIGRAWRNGTIGTAIGASGVPGLLDLRTKPDFFGRKLTSTELGLADELASAASLIMGQADEGRPIVLARGVPYSRREGAARELIRSKQTDLFRQKDDLTAAAEIMTAITERQTIRRFLPDPIPNEIVSPLLEAAARAPSAHNRQPWRFKIVSRISEKEGLAREMGARLRQDREADGDDPEAVDRDVERSKVRINGAPLVIAVCLTLDDMDHYPDDRRNRAEFMMAVQSTAMAAQNLLLAAHAEGLGACWMCAPLFCAEAVRSALTLPQSWQPQGLILLGRPAEPGRWRDRKNLAEITIGLDT